MTDSGASLEGILPALSLSNIGMSLQLSATSKYGDTSRGEDTKRNLEHAKRPQQSH
jgi:hypothetical protein